jgi:hypothetical protein
LFLAFSRINKASNERLPNVKNALIITIQKLHACKKFNWFLSNVPSIELKLLLCLILIS